MRKLIEWLRNMLMLAKKMISILIGLRKSVNIWRLSVKKRCSNRANALMMNTILVSIAFTCAKLMFLLFLFIELRITSTLVLRRIVPNCFDLREIFLWPVFVAVLLSFFLYFFLFIIKKWMFQSLIKRLI